MGQGRKYLDEIEYERMLRLQEWGEQGYMEDLDSQMGALELSDRQTSIGCVWLLLYWMCTSRIFFDALLDWTESSSK